MKHLKNKVVVITGAGSGIGRALAVQLAHEGCPVAINDIKDNYLKETLDLIHSNGGKASSHLADVSCRESVQQLSQEVMKEYGRVDILINNAGASLARMDIQHTSWENWEWIMKVNFWGTLNCVKIFYPYLLCRPEAHIVNVSSIYSLGGMRHRASYCASKFAVRGLTESMIQDADGTNIRISSVIPGGVKTNIAFHSRGYLDVQTQKKIIDVHERNSRTSPEKAAQIIIRGIKKNKKRILIGRDAWLMDYVIRLFPVFSSKIINSIIKKAER